MIHLIYIHMRQERSNDRLYIYREWFFSGMWCLPHNLSILGTDGDYAKFHAVVIGYQGENS